VCATGEQDQQYGNDDGATHSVGARNVTRPRVCVTPASTTIVVSQD
jgi:hypothetical protein